jgi:hypothetical protein
MTSFVPRSNEARDQKYAKSILTFHVLRSFATAGAFLCIPTAIASTLYYGPKTLPAFSTRLLVHSFRGMLGGIALGAIALEHRMWGKEHSEWQERSWKLLDNRGQMEVDTWILEGEVLGGVGAFIAARSGWLHPALTRKTMTTVVGGMGFGATVGTVSYMGWRHGIRGGKFPPRKNTAAEGKSTLIETTK